MPASKHISTMAAPTARTGKRTARVAKRLADLPSNKKETQQQAAAPVEPKPAPKRRMARPVDPTSTSPAGSRRGRGRQQQSADAGVVGKQGDSTSGKQSDASGEFRGGAKQVLIADVTLPTRSGRRRLPEDYPFAELAERPSKLVDGQISGPSFFIPESDRADGKVTVARKRYGGLWITRRTEEQVNGEGPVVRGLRVWRGSPELENVAKR